MIATSHRWGIDLGGTKIEAAILDPHNKPILRLRLPTEREKGYDHILGQVLRLVEMVEQKIGQTRPAQIGIGTPGVSDPVTGLLRNSNTTCMNGKPFRSDLIQLLGTDLVMTNDANCFALAEATLGVAKDFNTVFGVILGTGVGAGIVMGGRIHTGVHGVAGEWGHNILDPQGALCYCGKTGCVETILSGPALERCYTQLSGTTRSLKDISSTSTTDPHAAATIQRLLEQFAKGISVVLNILDPDVVVVGGGVGNIEALYSPAFLNLVENNFFGGGMRTRFLRPALGDSAGVFGAVLLTQPEPA